ncbi:UDP-N-acetylglucosamine pyrophosphorylase [Komagataella phaffii GS115]|uniref:UDP-N-acetylglucosamine diphosphorylase n=1 Tax=Komagataella phaffii (strain GS115 / ATCC 20864) TaxID=644223 RepID=C4R589_KOMPG|nr:UDP-N-acetylglucosamine pyrophosphorylase [Komagataella phaffii GS115]CAY70725.1 UDP-N-acetylglucosamine pyrophosphorylase [Komagataella phaffii GS115]
MSLEQYKQAGQSHLFQFWEELSPESQKSFSAQLSQFSDPVTLVETVKDALKFSASTGLKKVEALPATSTFSTLDDKTDPQRVRKFQDQGLKLISEGKVGLILMAGGQGTRLGSSLPKGKYRFFNQGTLPCFNETGEKILLESKSSICESPDGNGGLYKAIYDNNLLTDFNNRGIEHIHMYCVDNVMVKIVDPVFIGWSASNDYDIATKVVRKTNPEESVGLIALDSETKRPCVIEYSEISDELAQKRDEDGTLSLKAANIVNHYYKVATLAKEIPSWINSRKVLPFHIAKKKIACLDSNSGEIIKPQNPNGIKLEQFIFDVFPSIPLEKFGSLEVKRAQEFSPLKNAPGSKSDSPETARESYLKLSTKWIKENGASLESEDSLVEVSALTSYDGEGLDFVKGKVFKNGDVI